MRRLPLLAALLFAFTSPAVAQGPDDHRGVRDAVLDYVEGIYQVQPERIARSVHPTLHKQGMVSRDAKTYRGPMPMTYDQLHALAASWNKDNAQVDPATATKVVEVFDVQDATAIAKLTASWGTDYFLLAKMDGKWMIMQVLWQTPMAE
ncbi:MAG: nuclear transport factor 2 family protein [Gemmatimonadetes bacterium]|nr:nuclear transport factor 2 family protein [Gemmatimonadota bacterium]MCA9767800.1 nuclear transport factor 2 family protein [Gemmatimonadota bacterium]MCB9517605.1 nuclear transport factor 2 family protein [Gemmatimonadales bacterium]HPF61589.1 nuclear transport factor 2 family protein [Gemmatimonadales bacterium]